ncbi:MAG: hypothetical protein HY717_04440 [Planctomycetes bacterium]|nr:hypothetical protein [Planctomycetota bacterium]
MKSTSVLPPLDEAAWLEREARLYSSLTMEERVAWYRDLERCMWALAGENLDRSRDGDFDLGDRWRDFTLP